MQENVGDVRPRVVVPGVLPDRKHTPAQRDQREHFGERPAGRPLRNRPARRGAVRGAIPLERRRGRLGVLHHRMVREDVEGDRLLGGERMPGRDGEHPSLGQQGRPAGHAVERIRGDEDVHRAVEQARTGGGQLHLPDVDPAVGVPLAEQRGRLPEQRSRPLAEEGDPQLPRDTAAGVGGPPERLVHPGDQRREVVGELSADRREPDRSAGPLEEQGADPPFQPLDHLTDPPGRDAQAFGGPAEVQLLGKRQERLGLHPFQHDPPIIEMYSTTVFRTGLDGGSAPEDRRGQPSRPLEEC